MTATSTRRLIPALECAEVPPGTVASVDVDGRCLTITAAEDGWFAADATCPHAGAPLENAVVAGCLLVCPWHESVFDARTGQVLRGPARRNLRTYPTIVQDGTVLVELEEG